MSRTIEFLIPITTRIIYNNGLKSGGIFFLILFYKQSLSLLILVVIFLVVISYDYQVVEFN